MTRARAILSLKDFYDVIVVGGGITGAGTLLDSQSRGYSSVLFEMKDFASGTSSKSSKLIHGGLRYLQQREIGLVYESLKERQRLINNAAHLVEPIPFLIPLFGKSGVVSKSLVRAYQAVLWGYDLTGGFRIRKLHKKISKEYAKEIMPSLRTEMLVAGFLYYDAKADDARLTWTILRTACEIYGAHCLNYAKVTGFLYDGGQISGVIVSIQDGPKNISREIRSKVVINATGIFSDDTRALDEKKHPNTIRPAKGIHISVSRDRLACKTAVVLPVKKDKRSIFVIPNGAYTYVGTTDTDYEGSAEDIEITNDDIQYLLDAVNAVSDANIKPQDVLGAWAGLRPLLKSVSKRPSAKTTDMSRRHSVFCSPSGLVTVTGGKLTTYRKMAQDAIDVAEKIAGLGHIKSRTKTLNLIGAPEKGKDAIKVLDRDPKLALAWRVFGPENAKTLYKRYGILIDELAQLCEKNPDFNQPLYNDSPYLKVEALYAIQSEMAIKVDDVLSRRLRIAIYDAKGAIKALDFVIEKLIEFGLLSEVEKGIELDNFKKQLALLPAGGELGA